MNTTRSLSPLPRTESSPRLRSMPRGSAQSSAKRRPVEKNISNTALSRRSRSESPFGAASRRSRSPYSSVSICRPGTLGSSIFSADSDLMSRFARYFKKLRRAIA